MGDGVITRQVEEGIAEFFQTAVEREKIRLARLAGLPGPWTGDRAMSTWFFCNVRREDDRTTQWIAEHVRKPLVERGSGPELITGMAACRWINRVETLERLRSMLAEGRWDSEEVRTRLRDVSPLVGGAYLVKTPDGMNKLEGVIWCVEALRQRAQLMWMHGWRSLAAAHADLMQCPFLGQFMAYEVVSDLRWTPLLSMATDINSWAAAGPGCARGLSWVFHGRPDQYRYTSERDQRKMTLLMHRLLQESRSVVRWPSGWERWEMREVEHWACEYDKWCRATHLSQPLKRRYAGRRSA